MIKLQKSLKAIFLIILISLSSFKSQENYYEKLKQMASNPEVDHSIGSDGERREISHEEKELYNKPPVAPMLIRRFFCDIDIKMNSARQDVMKNHNYHK